MIGFSSICGTVEG